MSESKPSKPYQRQFLYVFESKCSPVAPQRIDRASQKSVSLNQRFSDTEHREKLRDKLLKQLTDSER